MEFFFLKIIKYRQHLTCFDYLYWRATALERHSRCNRIKRVFSMGFWDSLLNSTGLDLYCIRRLTLFESFNFFSSQKVCVISEMVWFISSPCFLMNPTCLDPFFYINFHWLLVCCLFLCVRFLFAHWLTISIFQCLYSDQLSNW